MKQYLYIYNYAPQEKHLCEIEFKQLFDEEMQSKYYFTNQFLDYTRSAFIKGRLDILEESNLVEEIIDNIKAKQMVEYDFKVIYLKNEITHVDYQESLQWCRDIADPIDGTVDMKNPKVIFALTKIQDKYYFGIWHNDALWSLRYEKPHSYSHSLNIRDARAIVNIAIGNEMHRTLVDPCCGIGTVVLEALSMGINVEGYDMNRDVSYQARLNVEHFGYEPLLIQCRDMRTLGKTYDVTIMDIPYGVYSPFTYQQQIELLQGASKLSERLVLVSHIDMNKELKDIGYCIIDQCTISKGNFKRYITLCVK